MPTFEDNMWKWRVYLPPGRTYALHTVSGHLPAPRDHPGGEWFHAAKRFGGSRRYGPNLNGEFTLEAKLVRQDDRWLLVTQYNKSDGDLSRRNRGRTRIRPDDWLDDAVLGDPEWRVTRSDVPAAHQAIFEPNEPILLLHEMKPTIIQSNDGGSSVQRPRGASDGFVLWFEPEVPDPPAAPKPGANE